MLIQIIKLVYLNHYDFANIYAINLNLFIQYKLILKK